MYTGMSVVLDNSRLHDPVTQAHPERGVVGGDESVAVNVDGRLTAASAMGVLHGPVGLVVPQLVVLVNQPGIDSAKMVPMALIVQNQSKYKIEYV